MTHDRFYWLEIPPGSAKGGQKIVANVTDNKIDLTGDVAASITLHLTDSLLDLDKPVVVRINGKEVFKGGVQRSAGAISEGLKARSDAAQCPFVSLKVGR